MPMGMPFGSLPSQPFGTAVGTIDVALKGVTGTGGVTFNIVVDDPSLAIAGGVSRSAPFRVNFDASASGATIDDVEAPATLWTSTSDPNGNTGSNWRRLCVAQ